MEKIIREGIRAAITSEPAITPDALIPSWDNFLLSISKVKNKFCYKKKIIKPNSIVI